MPSTIVKLSSGHARAWAHNQPVWLTEAGEISRAVTRAEQHAISRALERTRNVNKSFRLDLLVEDVVPTLQGMVVRRIAVRGRHLPSAAPVEKITCAFEVTIVGKKRAVTVWLGNLRYASGREVIAAELLADHGECVLHGRNGKCIGVLRDPLAKERAPNLGRRVQWSRTKEEKQAGEEALARELAGESVSPVKRQVHRARRVGPQQPVYSPDQCPNDCRGRKPGNQAWALAKGAIPPTELEHHPVCKYGRAWAETLSTPETTHVLYDLELGRVARGAMPEEIAEADTAERSTTMRNITVSNRLFAVLPRSEAEQAEREARGEVAAAPAASEGSDELAEGDEHELDTEVPPPPLAGSTGVEELDLPTAAASSAEERESWPDLEALAPEQHRQRAEVLAHTYLARSPQGPLPASPSPQPRASSTP
jgi:hypothetical protein